MRKKLLLFVSVIIVTVFVVYFFFPGLIVKGAMIIERGPLELKSMVIGDHNCKAEDFISITFKSSGLEEIRHQDFSMIFPNPAHNKLFLKSNFRGKQENVTVTIINQAGKMLLMRTFEELLPDETYEINLESVPAGLYFVRTSFTDHKYITRKIIVY